LLETLEFGSTTMLECLVIFILTDTSIFNYRVIEKDGRDLKPL